MSKHYSKEKPENNTPKITKISRRQFLQGISIATGFAAVMSILNSACRSLIITSAETAGSKTSSLSPSTSPISPITPNSTTPSSDTSTPPLTTYAYVPPTILPPLLPVYGTSCTVAEDRVYSGDNVWVKSLSPDVGVIGVSSKMADILGDPYKISLPKIGGILTPNEAIGMMEGNKMSADIISPISGTVIQVNELLQSLSDQGKPLDPLINDPYNAGWMFVAQLSKPEELDALHTAQSYRDLIQGQVQIVK